jgi:acyl-[acyl-carrier-protein]-phospholipid O-acyltransferase / long-chain-fatty-acid--[acyl-carrier-protein] ligase
MMNDKMFSLLSTRRFLPLFTSQFLGALNDNLFKNAMALLIIYRIGDVGGLSATVLTTIATGLFMLPYFLFSATAGELADHYEKSALLKIVKLGEIFIVLLGAFGLAHGNVTIMLTALFLLGAQSTFFAPIKYAILPELLRETELIGGNALIEGGTFLAILVGTITGGLLVLRETGVAITSCILIVVAITGFAGSLFLPKAAPSNLKVKISSNPLTGTLAALHTIRKPREVFLSVLGLSWFWAMGATFVTEFPAYAKDTLGADEHAVTLMLAMFSIGIGIGSVVCGKLLHGDISARFVPFGALGMTLFSFDFFFASGHGPISGELLDLSAFLARPSSWHILLDLCLIAGCGGIYTVPLYALLQTRTAEAERARVIAANNIMNAIFMVVASLIAASLLLAGVSVNGLFLVVAVFNAGVTIYICRLLPDDLLRGVLVWLLRLAYGIEVKGLDHLKRAGDRVVIVANHISLLDAMLVAVFIPNRPVFAIDTFMAGKWWIRPFLGLVEAFPLDPRANPQSPRRPPLRDLPRG